MPAVAVLCAHLRYTLPNKIAKREETAEAYTLQTHQQNFIT